MSATLDAQLKEDARYLGQRYVYPVTDNTTNDPIDLRTWLAGHALAGLSAYGQQRTIEIVAQDAVRIADAVLLELVRARVADQMREERAAADRLREEAGA